MRIPIHIHPEDVKEAVCEWLLKRYGFAIEQDRLQVKTVENYHADWPEFDGFEFLVDPKELQWGMRPLAKPETQP